jgi:glycosyltransferase involved in cell wall biosynthesis
LTKMAGNGANAVKAAKTEEWSLVIRRSLRDVFLEPLFHQKSEYPPLTPFLVHVWRANDARYDTLCHSAQDAEKFLYWFFETFHRQRAPYRWPVPSRILAWMNHTASEIFFGSNRPDWANPEERFYLTRFMVHAMKHFQNRSRVSDPDGYLQFLTWFAVECVPAWNLPYAFVPGDLLSVLNRPVREGLPLTVAMLASALAGTGETFPDACAASDAELLAIAFEQLPKLLQTGNSRLVPEYASDFWYRQVSASGDSLNAYEYLAASACHGTHDQHDKAALRQWFTGEYLTLVPEAAIFASGPQPGLSAGTECLDLRPPELTVHLYRDHRTVAGLAKAGLGIKDALIQGGVSVVDLDFSFGRERMREEHAHNSGQFCRGRRGLHILALNPEYVPECLVSHLSNLDDTDHIIGQFAWELPDISAVHECGLSLVDELWVPSRFVKSIYERHVRVPVYVMGHAIEFAPIDSRFSRASFDLPEDSYIFLFGFDAGSVIERKNPLAAIQAFAKAFPGGGERAVFVIKTRNIETAQSAADQAHWRQVQEIAAHDPRIRILNRTLSEEALHGLYTASDCYVSLHRSEGFGYGPAEAMARGKPVITTGYSGVLDFCTSDNSLSVSYTLEPVPPGAYPYMGPERVYQWASPDVDEAAFYMRQLYDDPTRGRRLGEAGRSLIRRTFSLEALQQRCLDRLIELGVV